MKKVYLIVLAALTLIVAVAATVDVTVSRTPGAHCPPQCPKPL